MHSGMTFLHLPSIVELGSFIHNYRLQTHYHCKMFMYFYSCIAQLMTLGGLQFQNHKKELKQ